MTLQELGTLIRKEREGASLTVDQVMESTKISRKNILAIEEGNKGDMPHPVYAKGFIRNYANSLGIDPKVVEEALKDAYGDISTVPRPEDGELPSMPEPEVQLQKKSSFFTVLLIIVLIGLVGAGSYYVFTSGMLSSGEKAPAEQAETVQTAEPEPEAALNPPLEQESLAAGQGQDTAAEQPAPMEEREQQDAEPAPAMEEESAPAGQQAAEPAPAIGGKLTILAKDGETCWMEVTADNGKPREYFLQSGQGISIDYMSDVKVRLGNAGGVNITHNGEKLKLNLEKGTVKTLNFPQ